METRDAIRSVVENIPGICQLKPKQEECLVFTAYLCLQRKFEAAETAHNIRHNQRYVIGYGYTNDFKLQTSVPP